MTPVELAALFAILAVVGLSLAGALLAARVQQAEERLADLRLRVFAWAELERDGLGAADYARERQLEALFPEIIRFEPVRCDAPAGREEPCSDPW